MISDWFMELTPEYSYVLLRYFSFYLLLLSWRGIAYNVGGMASKGLRMRHSYQPIRKNDAGDELRIPLETLLAIRVLPAGLFCFYQFLSFFQSAYR
jgi:hypothetical protein